MIERTEMLLDVLKAEKSCGTRKAVDRVPPSLRSGESLGPLPLDAA